MVPNQFSPTVNNLTHCRGRKVTRVKELQTINQPDQLVTNFFRWRTANDAN